MNLPIKSPVSSAGCLSAAALAFLLVVQPAQAVIQFQLATDAAGNFLTPGVSWSAGGTGTVQGPLDSMSGANGGEGLLVSSFSGNGTLGALPLAMVTRLAPGNAQNYVTMNYMLTPFDASMPHSGDIYADNWGPSGFRSLVVGNLQNVGSIKITATYDEPIAAEDAGGQAPWGLGIRQMNNNQVTGAMVAEPYDATFTVGQIQTVTGVTPLTSVVGLNGPVAPINRTGGSWAPSYLGGLTTSGSSITVSQNNIGGVGNADGSTLHDWMALRGLDADGTPGWNGSNTGNSVLDGDRERTYAQQFSFMLSPTGGGAFDSDQEFGSSFDGAQFESTLMNPFVVPEPSRALLLFGGILAACARRRR